MSELDSHDKSDSTTDTLPLTAEQRRELDRRLQSHREEPHAGSPWEEVKARLLRITEK